MRPFLIPAGPFTVTEEQAEFLRKRLRKLVVSTQALTSRLRNVDPMTDDMPRVNGNVLCPECDLPYNDHPEYPFPTSHVLCDGSLVKT